MISEQVGRPIPQRTVRGFDGVDNYVATGVNSSGLSDLKVCAWFKRSADDGYIIGKAGAGERFVYLGVFNGVLVGGVGADSRGGVVEYLEYSGDN